MTPNSQEWQRSFVGRLLRLSMIVMNTYDVAVIGGGAAGLSAALVLARARRAVVVVDAGTPRNAPAVAMYGFISRDGQAPSDLLATARGEVSHYGGAIVHGTVTFAGTDDSGRFVIRTTDRRQFSARRLLITTGLRDELPEVLGLRDRWGHDVLHCPYCHGHEVRDQRLGVLGWTDSSVRYTQLVRQWSNDVVHFTGPETLTSDERIQLTARGVAISEGLVQRLVVVDDELRGVQLEDGCVVPCQALFVPPRFVPNSQLLIDLGCETGQDGWVITDSTGRTSNPRVWAAGNVADPRAQVITAAGQGSAAAIALNADLVDEDVRAALDRISHSTSRPDKDHT